MHYLGEIKNRLFLLAWDKLAFEKVETQSNFAREQEPFFFVHIQHSI
jgi:hypothetical protein